MIYVYGNSFTSIDKESFRGIMSHFKIAGDKVQFVDLDHEDINLEGKNFILTVDRALQKVTRALVNGGKYKPTELLGKDVVDPIRGFHLFNIPLTISEMRGSIEDKTLTKNKLDLLVKFYNEFFPFDDEIPDIVNTVEANVPAIESKTATYSPSAVRMSGSLGEVPVDVRRCLDGLCEHVNLADNGLGKSLSKYEKFVLMTPGGTIGVYPNNRINEDDQYNVKITFKDLVALLKICVYLDVGTITFGPRNGVDVFDQDS
jgi:hypothetical protein